jgi:hypothetical protein
VRRGQTQRKSSVAYIKISEEEIADDYPLPQMYVKEHEETDELLVMGDESMMLDIDTEALPTQVRLSCWLTSCLFCCLMLAKAKFITIITGAVGGAAHSGALPAYSGD